MIEFFFEDVEGFDIQAPLIKWLENLIFSEGFQLGPISYILCSDSYLLEINKTYLNHNYYTDIITFDYVRGKTISGDIFVSLHRILENSNSLSTSYEDELHRVLAHGLLHLCGYKDKTEEEKSLMREKENWYLAKR